MSPSYSSSAKLHQSQKLFEHDSTILKIQNILPKGLQLGAKILDIGCGDGKLSQYLIDQGYKVTGLDINAEGLEKAKKRGIKTYLADLEQAWPLDSETFDLVLMLDVFEHVTNMEFILDEIKRVLKPDGQLIVIFPNHFDLRNRLNILFGGGIIHWDHKKYKNTKAWNYGHLRFLRLQELKQLLIENGFYIEKIQLNFMGGGIIPTRYTPNWLRRYLTSNFPELFSGKFGMLCSLNTNSNSQEPKIVIIEKTVKGM